MDDLCFSHKFTEKYEEGATVFEEGSQGDKMYVVVEGEVGLFKNDGKGEFIVASLVKGDFFGEMGLIDSAPRTATARAVKAGTKLIQIDQAKFIYLVSQQPVFALTIMQTLSKRLRLSDQARQNSEAESGNES